jgi:RNA methyltransferase, TrmH family
VSLESLPQRFQRIACLDLEGEPVTAGEFRGFDCYVFGNEARGLPRERMESLGARAFTIPGTHAIESLNVAASVNISLYELNRAG